MGSRSVGRVPFIAWDDIRDGLDWRQGEHVTILGPTGCGKSTIALALSDHRGYVAVVATKPRDRTLSGWAKREGVPTLRKWPPAQARRVIFWPPISKMRQRNDQANAIARMLESVYEAGAWCVVIDELEYVCRPSYLGLETHVAMMLQQARSLGVSMVGCCQRPRHVPLAAFSAATHLLLFRTSDRQDLRRLGELNGADTDTVQRTLPHLEKHEALYVNTRDGSIFRTRTR